MAVIYIMKSRYCANSISESFQIFHLESPVSSHSLSRLPVYGQELEKSDFNISWLT